jgi:hypothetical protein
MQCRIDLDAASSASLATSDRNFLACGSPMLRQGSKRARKTATDLLHLDAAGSVSMAAEYKQYT